MGSDCVPGHYLSFYFTIRVDRLIESESESELLLVTRQNDKHSPGPGPGPGRLVPENSL